MLLEQGGQLLDRRTSSQHLGTLVLLPAAVAGHRCRAFPACHRRTKGPLWAVPSRRDAAARDFRSASAPQRASRPACTLCLNAQGTQGAEQWGQQLRIDKALLQVLLSQLGELRYLNTRVEGSVEGIGLSFPMKQHPVAARIDEEFP